MARPHPAGAVRLGRLLAAPVVGLQWATKPGRRSTRRAHRAVRGSGRAVVGHHGVHWGLLLLLLLKRRVWPVGVTTGAVHGRRGRAVGRDGALGRWGAAMLGRRRRTACTGTVVGQEAIGAVYSARDARRDGLVDGDRARRAMVRRALLALLLLLLLL